LNYQTGDRLVLQSEIKTYDGIVSSNAVCTLFSHQSDDLVIVRYGTDSETKKPKIIGVPIAMLAAAKQTDLHAADYKQLLPEQFISGQKFKVGNIRANGVEKGDLLTVEGVELKLQEKQDVITFSNIHGKADFKFERNFVDMYFDIYDEEIEQKFGEEVIINDMKTAPRNYYLPGARMVIGPYEKQKIVILTSDLGKDVYEVEDNDGVKYPVEKDKLMPISQRETLYTFPATDVIQKAYWSGKKFKALDSVDKNFLLSKRLNPGDKVEIIANDSINCNAMEDIFEVKTAHGATFYLSFAELRTWFTPIDNVKEEDEQEQFQKTYINVNFEQKLREATKNNEESVEIHELSISGFRFGLDKETFTLDGNEYRKDNLDTLIIALNKLKEYI
jgi:hypothetical protein